MAEKWRLQCHSGVDKSSATARTWMSDKRYDVKAHRADRLRLNALCFLYAKNEPTELPGGAFERERMHHLLARVAI